METQNWAGFFNANLATKAEAKVSIILNHQIDGAPGHFKK